jgi:hypothetical protein
MSPLIDALKSRRLWMHLSEGPHADAAASSKYTISTYLTGGGCGSPIEEALPVRLGADSVPMPHAVRYIAEAFE